MTQRKAGRRRVLKAGTIILGRDAKISCTIRNLSEFGACLVLQSTLAIPTTFLLSVSGEPARLCKAMWRTNERIGIRFLEHAGK
jgi:hypothetical protein